MNIEGYTGLNIADKLTPLGRELYLGNLNYMKVAFGENVEYQRLLGQVLFCPETEEFLYSEPAPTAYEWGSRPVLEEAVAVATKGCSTPKEKVLGLMSYIRDLKDKVGGRDYFYGGTEEELIKKGERYCERVARLMCGLCDIAGLPARVVFHLSGGHLTNEVWYEGGWHYVDPRFGLFYLDSEGELMSVRDIVCNREVIFNQPGWVYDYGSKEATAEAMAKDNHDMYLRPGEIQLYGDYRLSDRDKYNYGWMPSAIHKVPERDEAYRGYATPRLAFLEKYK